MPKLHEIVSSQGNQTSGKRKVGYTVGAYAGVLSALEKANRTQARNSGNVLGNSRIDWQSTAAATYDDSGFSSNINSGLWKMAMTFNGAIPINILQNDSYEILHLPGDSEDTALKRDGLKRWCPYQLNPEAVGACTVKEFAVGGYIDLSSLGEKYFNHFYGNAACKFDQKKISELIDGGYLMAQITFVDQKKFKLVKVLGQISIQGSAQISLSIPLLGTKEWKDIGIQLNGLENSSNKVSIIPASDKYKFVCDGMSYHHDTGTIDDFNTSKFNDPWLKNSSEKKTSPDKVQLSLEAIQPRECLVRLYVPKEHKDQALVILKGNPNDFLFQESFEMEYVAAQADQYTGDSCTNANTAEMIKCIETICNNRNMATFSQKTGQKASFGFPNGWNLQETLKVTNAMRGTITIPQGWPMCTMSLNPGVTEGRKIYDERGNPPSYKGLPSSGIPTFCVEKDAKGECKYASRWFYCKNSNGEYIEDGDRLDSALKCTLSSDMLNGNMPAEWYKNRMIKAYGGVVIIHVNSDVAAQMQNFINQTWNYYKEAADLYNKNRPEEEKVSTGELMLRCAPSLCSWHGNTAVHRNRYGKGRALGSGHDAGGGWDFAYNNNRENADIGYNFNKTDIGRRCNTTYRPMMQALYTNGGGCAVEHKFMGGKKFDAMHIQFKPQ